MVAELCMLFGWTVDECLNMPAKTFFSMRKKGLKVKRSWNDTLLAELVMVARVPEMIPKSVEALYNYYRGSAEGVVQRRSKTGMDPTDPEVQRILASQFTQAMKLQGF